MDRRDEAVSEFIRTGANQNIDPEYVKMVGGVSNELKEIDHENDNVYFITKDGE